MKQAIADRTTVRGFHLTFPSPVVIEVAASLDLGFVYLDGEHGAFELRDIEACCVMAERHGLTPIARVAENTVSAITRFLDRGVRGIVVPHVETVEDARRAIEATYFAPLGQRSFGGGRPHDHINAPDLPRHLQDANEGVSLCLMIESAAGLEAMAEIVALEGVDYVSFGMMDLSQSLGHAGNPGHPAVREALRKASETARAAGKPVREDFMAFAWIHDAILTGLGQILDERGKA
ncbi:HpcH/HpaI aldolase family protein [Muricoccus radiodurans]|uniref:HpcH/HpaI aldolase family protein n=1 Tax=Muricoccus radiodurans TaxID=2231721 RepID=UPI003CF98551